MCRHRQQPRNWAGAKATLLPPNMAQSLERRRPSADPEPVALGGGGGLAARRTQRRAGSAAAKAKALGLAKALG